MASGYAFLNLAGIVGCLFGICIYTNSDTVMPAFTLIRVQDKAILFIIKTKTPLVSIIFVYFLAENKILISKQYKMTK